MPLPVWNCQSRSPVRASRAMNSPVGSPAKTTPPAVASTEATIGCSVRCAHTSRPVDGADVPPAVARARVGLRLAAPERHPLAELLRPRLVRAALLDHRHVQPPRGGAVGGVRPLLGARGAWADLDPLRRRT